MRRDDRLHVLGHKLDQHFVKLIKSDLVVLSESGLQLGNVPDNVAAFLATRSLAIYPEPDDFRVELAQLVDVGILIGIGHALKIVQVGTSP